jgi:GNAT superfamily N-acetyltransferase
VRLRTLDLADRTTALDVLRVQRAAYAREAALLGDDRIPPLHESLAELQSTRLHWLGADERGRLLGAVAWSQEPGPVDVHRLVVDPSQHRRGLGRALVQAVLDRTTGPVVVSTGRDNTPALRLYASLGFVEDPVPVEVVPGLWVVRLSLAREATSSTSCPAPSSR